MPRQGIIVPLFTQVAGRFEITDFLEYARAPSNALSPTLASQFISTNKDANSPMNLSPVDSHFWSSSTVVGMLKICIGAMEAWLELRNKKKNSKSTNKPIPYLLPQHTVKQLYTCEASEACLESDLLSLLSEDSVAATEEEIQLLPQVWFPRSV